MLLRWAPKTSNFENQWGSCLGTHKKVDLRKLRARTHCPGPRSEAADGAKTYSEGGSPAGGQAYSFTHTSRACWNTRWVGGRLAGSSPGSPFAREHQYLPEGGLYMRLVPRSLQLPPRGHLLITWLWRPGELAFLVTWDCNNQCLPKRSS